MPVKLKMEKVVLSPETVLLHGRVFFENEKLVLDWINSGFSFCFKGTKFSIEIEGNFDEKYKFFGVLIDDQPIDRQIMTTRTHIYEKEVPEGIHKVKFMRMSGVYLGIEFTVKSLMIQGELLPKPEESKRKIEFIGDSITNGYGVLGEDVGNEYDAKFEDPSKSYTYMSADHFGAEARFISWSGKGIYKDNAGNPLLTARDWFPKLSPIREEKYDFKWQPDLVVIGLGTNDCTGGVAEEDFIKYTREFLDMVRKVYPKQPIIWVYGLMRSEYIETVKKALKEYNDPNLQLIIFNGLEDGEYGNRKHPNVKANKRVAPVVINKIKEVMGW